MTNDEMTNKQRLVRHAGIRNFSPTPVIFVTRYNGWYLTKFLGATAGLSSSAALHKLLAT